MAIEITGLTQRQRALADVLWMMDGKAEVDKFIKALHPTMRADAVTVVEMMILAVVDEVDSIDESTKILLDNLK